jgi:FecR protein
MSSSLLALVLMQYVVSVKAGLVNHVQGTVNVAEMEMARQGQPVRTGANGYAEILLTPGSFLRVGENSSVVLDGVELESVSLRVTQGNAVIEVVEISKTYPIRVTTGNLTMNIVATGIYKFADGMATVLSGKLQTPDSKLAYEKGWQVFFKDNYRARKIGKVQTTSLDVYSQTRSQLIASANYTMATQISGSQSSNPYWLFAPHIGFYTYIPWRNFRSPYGYLYYGAGVRRAVVNNRSSPAPDSNDSGGASSRPPSTNTGGNSDNGGGGGGAAPAITVNTPSGERTAPAVYIESKSTPVGATQ